MYDTKKDEYIQVSSYEGEDREPVWGNDDNTFYYLSERDGGAQNIYKGTIGGQSSVTELTKFKDNPVRFLSRASDGTLCFTNNGEIYTMKENGSPEK